MTDGTLNADRLADALRIVAEVSDPVDPVMSPLDCLGGDREACLRAARLVAIEYDRLSSEERRDD